MSRPVFGSVGQLYETRREDPSHELLNPQSSLRIGGKNADLTIKCWQRQWPVHRAIVCQQSTFFDGVCNNPSRKGASKVIDLSEDDIDAVEQMVKFFYDFDYLNTNASARGSAMRRNHSSRHNGPMAKDPLFTQAGDMSLPTPGYAQLGLSPRDYFTRTDSSSSSSSDSSSVSSSYLSTPTPTQHGSLSPFTPFTPFTPFSPSHSRSLTPEKPKEVKPEPKSHNFLLHARVYALAEKYDIPALKALACRKFDTELGDFFRNVQNYASAPTGFSTAATYAAKSADLMDSIEEVYSSTGDADRGMRDVVVKGLSNNGWYTRGVADVVRGVPGLEGELFRAGAEGFA